MNSAYSITDFELTMDDSLLLSETVNQIYVKDSVFGIRKNFLDIFNQKHRILQERRETEDDEVDPEAMDADQEIENKFYASVLSTLREVPGIIVDTADGSFSKESFIHLYSALVPRLHEHMISYITAFILANKQLFVSQFDSDTLGNMTVKQARQQFKNKGDATIIVHYHHIVEMMLGDDNFINPDTILTTLYKSDQDDYEYIMLMSHYQTCALQFDIPKWNAYIRGIYMNPEALQNLKLSVLERLIPVFPQRTREEMEANPNG